VKGVLTCLAAAVATAVVASTASGGGAPVAVLIPARVVCADGGATIRLGWRYTDNPPGPRRFTARLRDPRGMRLLERRGLAPPEWRVVRYDPPVRASALGVYRTIYVLPTGTEIFRTLVVRCRS
jgi:hypothetical protein